MRKLWIIALVLFVQCKSTSNEKNVGGEATIERTAESDTTTLLQQYWILADADNPEGSDIIQKEDGVDYMPGIVFITDGGLTENPAGKLRTGSYERFGDSISAEYADGKKASYIIKSLNPDSLKLERTEGKDVSTLHYAATNTWWPSKERNPFSVENLAWTIKPKEAETDDQIKERCQGYIKFCQYYIEGYARGNATKISFVGLPNILNYYTGAISIPSDKNLNKKWLDCFYDKDDALKGYTMIRRAILKDYKWNNDEPNWIKQTGPVLEAMRDSL